MIQIPINTDEETPIALHWYALALWLLIFLCTGCFWWGYSYGDHTLPTAIASIRKADSLLSIADKEFTNNVTQAQEAYKASLSGAIDTYIRANTDASRELLQTKQILVNTVKTQFSVEMISSGKTQGGTTK